MKIAIIKLLLKKLNEKQKAEILTEAVKHLYNTIGSDDLLQKVGNDWLLGRQRITEAEVLLIGTEAEHLLKTRLWKVMKVDLCNAANEKMFTRSANESDMVAGKLWVFTIDQMKRLLTRLSRIKKVK